MKSLRRVHDDPDDLKARIAAAKARRRGFGDIERRLVIAVCQQIRKEVRLKRKASA